MWSRVLRRLLLSSAIVCLFLCLAPKLAHAQAAITIYQETSLPRVDENGKQLAKRPINLTPEGVNNDDCIKNVRIRFSLQVNGFQGNSTIEAWAGLSGQECAATTDRTGVSRQCWKLAGVPLQLNTIVDIPVRTIMSGVKGVQNIDDSPAICGTVDLTTISVNFLYFAPGQTGQAASNKSISVVVDTVGPSAPTGLNVLPGNTRLAMNWNNISGEGGVSVLTGIRVYCDPNLSTGIPNVPACQNLIKERAALGDAGTSTTSTTDAGTDSGTVAAILPDGGCVDELDDSGDATFTCPPATSSTSDGSAETDSGESDGGIGTFAGTCSNANFTGKFAPTAAFNECFSCGSITGNTGTSVVAGDLRGAPLENGTYYAVAVAATDAFDNVGPLSAPLCNFPEETNDFWADYKKAGGHAGGGCNTTGDAPLGSLTLLGTSAAVVISRLRRRKKKNGGRS
jgi:hypothetical protein